MWFTKFWRKKKFLLNRSVHNVLDMIQKYLLYCLIFSQQTTTKTLANQYVDKFCGIYHKLENLEFKKFFLNTILTINEYKIKVCEFVMETSLSLTKKSNKNQFENILDSIEYAIQVGIYFLPEQFDYRFSSWIP